MGVLGISNVAPDPNSIFGSWYITNALNYWTDVFAGDRSISGQYTPQGAAQLVAIEANQQIAMGVDPAIAHAQAVSDVKNILLNDNADPSQTPTLPDLPTTGMLLLAAGLVVGGFILAKRL